MLRSYKNEILNKKYPRWQTKAILDNPHNLNQFAIIIGFTGKMPAAYGEYHPLVTIGFHNKKQQQQQ